MWAGGGARPAGRPREAPCRGAAGASTLAPSGAGREPRQPGPPPPCQCSFQQGCSLLPRAPHSHPHTTRGPEPRQLGWEGRELRCRGRVHGRFSPHETGWQPGQKATEGDPARAGANGRLPSQSSVALRPTSSSLRSTQRNAWTRRKDRGERQPRSGVTSRPSCPLPAGLRRSCSPLGKQTAAGGGPCRDSSPPGALPHSRLPWRLFRWESPLTRQGTAREKKPQALFVPPAASWPSLPELQRNCRHTYVWPSRSLVSTAAPCGEAGVPPKGVPRAPEAQGSGAGGKGKDASHSLAAACGSRAPQIPLPPPQASPACSPAPASWQQPLDKDSAPHRATGRVLQNQMQQAPCRQPERLNPKGQGEGSPPPHPLWSRASGVLRRRRAAEYK